MINFKNTKNTVLEVSAKDKQIRIEGVGLPYISFEIESEEELDLIIRQLEKMKPYFND